MTSRAGSGPLHLNLDLISKRTADIKQALQVLAGYAALAEDDFLADATTRSAAKYQLLVAVEAAQSICNHLAARVARTVPASYAECFLLLVGPGVISKELAAQLANMAKFRNLLVHQYASIDDGRVYAIINREIKDLEKYVARVAEFVNRTLEDGR